LLFERSSPNTRGAAMGSYNFAFSRGKASVIVPALDVDRRVEPRNDR
jgi:hypothetical protein